MATQPRQNRRMKDRAICSDSVLLLLGLLFALFGVVLVIIGAVKLHAANEKCIQVKPSRSTTLKKRVSVASSQFCRFSDEAVRVGLPALLEEVKSAYFTHNPNNVAWNPDLIGREMTEYVKTR